MKRTLLALALVGTGAAVLTVPSASASPEDRGLTAVRAVTHEYADPQRALADGYLATDHCIELPDGSAGMGYHYVKPELLDGRLELGRPEVLLYGDGPAGSRVLLGAEYVVVDRDQDLSTDGDRPTAWGHPFDGPMEGHGGGMPRHYDLHVWAWQDNPAGAWRQWNPTVDC